MSIPVAGSVLLRDNQAVVVLSVAQDGAAAPGGPGGGPADNLQMLLNQVLAGDHAVHESRQPLARKHLAAMVCNIQKGLRLAPVGLLGSWSPDASRKLLHALEILDLGSSVAGFVGKCHSLPQYNVMPQQLHPFESTLPKVSST